MAVGLGAPTAWRSTRGLTLQAAVRQGRVRRGQLPPVEAMVLYTDGRPWSGSLRLGNLCMPCPEGLAVCQLGIECTLVQACHEQDLRLEPLNLSDAVFRLLQGAAAEVADMGSRLQRLLARRRPAGRRCTVAWRASGG